MSIKENSKPYDLEERTYLFAKEVALFIKTLPLTISNAEYAKQVIRSSASPAANYIEANESLGKKDFLMKLKTCRREAKETTLWLRLLVETNNEKFSKEGKLLIQEAGELKMIFSTIIKKSS